MIAIQENKYVHIIKECFSTDEELLSTWHIEAPADVDVCSERTINDLRNAANFTFYSLMEENEIAGFFGLSDINGVYYCNGFFLKPEYRHMKKEFLNEIMNKTGDIFYTAIHSKNKRASNFLSKHGVIQEQNEQYQFFKMQPKCLS